MIIDDPKARLPLRDGTAAFGHATASGQCKCIDCSEPYNVGDEIITFKAFANSPDVTEDGVWHVLCWRRTNRTSEDVLMKARRADNGRL